MLTAIRCVKDLELFKTEVPYELFGVPEGTSNRITNCEYTTVEGVKVQDVRTAPGDYTLETTGFKYIRSKSNCSLKAEHFEAAGSSMDNNPVVLEYLTETIDLIKREFQTQRVICCDWRFRRTGAPPSIALSPDDTYNIRYQALAPGLDIHCDFSQRGGMERLEMHLLPEELEDVKGGHWKAKIVNVWRPLNIVKNAPLIITDRRTVLQSDLMEVEKVLPDKVERNYYVKFQPYHEYFYMSDQGPEEVAIFTSWDGDEVERTAGYSPHGAASYFSDDWKKNPRESIEVRLIVITAA